MFDMSLFDVINKMHSIVLHAKFMDKYETQIFRQELIVSITEILTV